MPGGACTQQNTPLNRPLHSLLRLHTIHSRLSTLHAVYDLFLIRLTHCSWLGFQPDTTFAIPRNGCSHIDPMHPDLFNTSKSPQPTHHCQTLVPRSKRAPKPQGCNWFACLLFAACSSLDLGVPSDTCPAVIKILTCIPLTDVTNLTDVLS